MLHPPVSGAMAILATLVGTTALAADFTYEPIDVADDAVTDLVSYLAERGDESVIALGALQEDDAEEAVEEEPPGTWHGSFGGYLSGSAGVSEKLDLRLSAAADREGEWDETRLNAEYYLATAFGDKTENKFIAEALQKWYFEETRRWSFFLQGIYQYDDLQFFEHRVQLYAGIGYKFIDQEDLWLEGRVGAGGIWERKPDDDIEGSMILELETEWDINDKTRFTGLLRYTPRFDDWDKGITLLRAELSTDIAESLALVIGVRDEYTAQADGPNNDLKAYAGITYDW